MPLPSFFRSQVKRLPVGAATYYNPDAPAAAANTQTGFTVPATTQGGPVSIQTHKTNIPTSGGAKLNPARFNKAALAVSPSTKTQTAAASGARRGGFAGVGNQPKVHDLDGASPMMVSVSLSEQETGGHATIGTLGNIKVLDGARSASPRRAPAATLQGQIANLWEGTPYQGGFGAPSEAAYGNAAELAGAS